MKKKTIDVTGIGNAIVDVLASVEDSFLDEFGLVKGSMTLIDETLAYIPNTEMPDYSIIELNNSKYQLLDEKTYCENEELLELVINLQLI